MQDLGASATAAFERLARAAEERERRDQENARQTNATPAGSTAPAEPLTQNDLLPPDSELESYRRSRLLELPATEFLERDVDLLRERFGRATEDSALRNAIMIDLARADRRLEHGRERDAIQRTRPADCFCLGLGGRQPSFVILPAVDDLEEETISTWVIPCGCPDGKAMTKRKMEAIKEYTRRNTLKRMHRVFGTPALRDYQDATMASIEETLSPDNYVAYTNLLEWTDARSDHVDHQDSVLIHGPVGSGKTYLAVALMRARVEQGEGALFITADDFFQRIRDSFDPDSKQHTSEVIATSRTVALLVLDDLGAKRKMTEFEEDQFRGLVNARMTARAPMIVTTNLTEDELRDHLDERAYSRLKGACRNFTFTWAGSDRRLERSTTSES